MTNEQLAILLDNYAAALQGVIDEVRGSLPDDVEREMEWHYKGNIMAAAIARVEALATGEWDPRLWEQVPGDALCLAGLHDLHERLLQHIETLRGIHGAD